MKRSVCVEDLEEDHPRLSIDGYTITSRCTDEYNCFAYAAADFSHWWEPTRLPLPPYYWPVAQFDYTSDSFIQAFQTLGFEIATEDSKAEDEELIAIFIDECADVVHAAVQEEKGVWKSKCGDRFDIVHDLNSLTSYGTVSFFMKRKRVRRETPIFDNLSDCEYHKSLSPDGRTSD